MFAGTRFRSAAPGRVNSQQARQRIEVPLLREQNPIGLPPVAGQKTRHYPVTASAMPDEKSAWFEDTRKFADDSSIVGGVREETERREEIDYRVEPARPARRQLAHVATRVTQVSARPALSRDAEQLLRVIEAVDVKPVFREQVSVTSLPAGHVEDARARRETE